MATAADKAAADQAAADKAAADQAAAEQAAAEQAAAEQAAADQAKVETAPETVTCKNVSKMVISTSKGNLAPGETGTIPFGEWTALVTCGLEPV